LYTNGEVTVPSADARWTFHTSAAHTSAASTAYRRDARAHIGR